MKLIPFEDCDRSLNFEPCTSWPKALPPFAWNRELLCAFDQSFEAAVELNQEGQHENSEEFLKAFVSCHPSLTLAELGRFFHRWQETESFRLDFAALFSEYGLRDSENLRRTLHLLASAPKNFQDWTSEKSLSAKDLAPLRALESIQPLVPALEAFPSYAFSKSQGVRALELVVDLYLMDKDWSQIWPHPLRKPESGSYWLQHLEFLRAPRAKSGDQDRNKKIEKLPWPKKTSAKWVRHGDETSLEIKIWIDSEKDFEKQLNGLSRVRQVLQNEDSQQIWNI